MKVTKNRVVTTTGENRRPQSGEATFSDGKTFDWMRLPDGEIKFYSYRRTHEGTAWSLVSFASPKREAAVRAYLET